VTGALDEGYDHPSNRLFLNLTFYCLPIK